MMALNVHAAEVELTLRAAADGRLSLVNFEAFRTKWCRALRQRPLGERMAELQCDVAVERRVARCALDVVKICFQVRSADHMQATWKHGVPVQSHKLVALCATTPVLRCA